MLRIAFTDVTCLGGGYVMARVIDARGQGEPCPYMASFRLLLLFFRGRSLATGESANHTE